MPIQPMYKKRWTELFVCTLVVALISLLINAQNSAGIIIITSLASTSLALMIAPGAATNSIHSVLLSYSFAIIVSVSLGLIFSLYIDALFENSKLLFFIKFFVMLLATLFLFGAFNAYHPPAIGAMLTYLIDTDFDDFSLIIYTPISVVFLLATIKSYIYMTYPDFKWKDFGMEFSINFRKRNDIEYAAGAEITAQQIAMNLKKENIDIGIIKNVTQLPEDIIRNL